MINCLKLSFIFKPKESVNLRFIYFIEYFSIYCLCLIFFWSILFGKVVEIFPVLEIYKFFSIKLQIKLY